MKDNKFPCIDCITLAICKGRMVTLKRLNEINLLHLMDKCSLIRDYIHYTLLNEDNDREERLKLIEELYNFYQIPTFSSVLFYYDIKRSLTSEVDKICDKILKGLGS